MIGQDLTRTRTVVGHLLAALGRAFLKISATFLGFGIVGAGIVEGVNFTQTQNLSAATTLTHITAAAFGLVLGYAAGLTMAVVEAIRAIIDTGKEAVKDVENVEQTITKDAGGLIQTVEGGIKKLEHR
jgi:hypothetical protein